MCCASCLSMPNQRPAPQPTTIMSFISILIKRIQKESVHKKDKYKIWITSLVTEINQTSIWFLKLKMLDYISPFRWISRTKLTGSKILMLTRIFNFKNYIVQPQQFRGLKWWLNLGINYWNLKEINSMNIKELGIQWRTSNCWCWDYYSESNHEQYGRWEDKFSGHVRKFLRTIPFQEKRTLWNFST